MSDTPRTLRAALESARDRAYDGSSKTIIRGAIEEAIGIFNACDWALDGWQQDSIPYREVHDPATFNG